MDIQVRNEDAAINTCQQILSFNKQNAAYTDSLESALKKMNAAWESNGQDKASYVAELEKQIQNLRIMEKGINDLASSILSYVENIKTTSAKSI